MNSFNHLALELGMSCQKLVYLTPITSLALQRELLVDALKETSASNDSKVGRWTDSWLSEKVE